MIEVGIDWAEDHHDVAVLDEQGRLLASRRIPEGVEGLARLHAVLAEQVQDPAQVLVGVQTDRRCAGSGRLPGLCGQPASGRPLP